MGLVKNAVVEHSIKPYKHYESLNVYFVLSDCCLVHFLFFSLCRGDFHAFKCTAIVVIIIFEIV